MNANEFNEHDLQTIRFTNPVLLGISLEPRSWVAPGVFIDGRPIVALSVYSEMFLKIQFEGSFQFVPWAAVSTVVFKEKPVKGKAK